MTTTPSQDALADLDRRHVFHPFSVPGEHERAGPRRMIVSGRGTTLTDEHGRTYLDAMAGLWCVNVGYGSVEIADALREQALRLAYYHSFSSMATDTPALLAARILEKAPANMSKVLYGNSGSDANDTQMKLVRMYNNLLGRPQKKKFISRLRGYHGVSIASASLTGLPGMHKMFDLPIDGVVHTRAPHRLWEALPNESDADFSARLARELEALIIAEGPDTVAAFIAEPVQAAGGVIVPPAGYFAAIQAVLRKYDVLLIADEVVCGFGRLGTWFGSDQLGIEPDLMTIAKGVTSAYVPLSACIVSEKVWRVLADESRGATFSHGYTYTSHPLAAAAALANLDVIERDGLLEQVRLRGAHLQARLREAFAGHPIVGEVRGIGLVGAVEFVAARDPLTRFDPLGSVGAAVTRACLERGVITRALPESDSISFSPPFVVTDAEIDEIVGVAREAADEVAATLA
ncbi:aminotransferase [Conexibacter sp. CPCC 206217]|uniref:aminotransferase n=1 Tax=Conexibacter sp. CPCC 206217 TaxID=3064574 RepID=UPI00272647F0|nr:aminotransferase [Conexibacter sp. CPCC 206217]MDO8209035.1 aminotransferase [Conexibacter sp. CPCC 206217]